MDGKEGEKPHVVKGQGQGKRVGAGKATAALAATVGKRSQSEREVVPTRHERVHTGKQGDSNARETVTLPLALHARVQTVLRESDEANETMYWLADVLDRQPASSPDDPRSWQYYVHFYNLNRRMDRWVSADQMLLHTVELQSERMHDLSTEVGSDQPDNSKGKQLPGTSQHPHHSAEQAHEGGLGNNPHNSQHHQEGAAKVRNVLQIELGRHVIDTWYWSPFPSDYTRLSSKLFFCEFTLKFFTRKSQMQRHTRKLKHRCPPGDEIYRDGSIAMFEVDGRQHREYCQNLCWLAKLFLDHKSLYYDVDLFLFYVQCEVDDRGYHITGYFSKEKFSDEGYNLACILTLPPYQRKGYGKFLISFSYELSKKERRVGTPERPLSDLGLVSYRSYWTRVILDIIQKANEPLSINDVRDATMIKADDIVSTLQYLQMLGFTSGRYVIYAPPDMVQAHLKNAGSQGKPVKAEKLVWTPWMGDRDLGQKSS
jgi:histone acetyltransferase MYST1